MADITSNGAFIRIQAIALRDDDLAERKAEAEAEAGRWYAEVAGTWITPKSYSGEQIARLQSILIDVVRDLDGDPDSATVFAVALNRLGDLINESPFVAMESDIEIMVRHVMTGHTYIFSIVGEPRQVSRTYSTQPNNKSKRGIVEYAAEARLFAEDHAWTTGLIA